MPRELVVACSGGVDSMAVLDFLRRKHSVRAAFYHHGTSTSDSASVVVAQYCAEHNIPLFVGQLNGMCPPGLSREEWWRNKRYEFLDGLGSTLGPIITAHHLDDSVETYIWSALNGTPKVIPLQRNNVLRPFLTTHKVDFIDWCERHGVEWAHDATNDSTGFTRNYIRHQLLPHALHVNPGIHTVVKKIILRQLQPQPIDKQQHVVVESSNW